MEDDIITQFCEDIILGPTGLHVFEDREMAVPRIDRDVAVACWVIRCLANPRNPKSHAVLKHIQINRLAVIQENTKGVNNANTNPQRSTQSPDPAA